ncbi:MAG: transcription termination factor NusA [Patescibacteria group bacterium]|jgi:N utilization substance protein A
MAITEFNAALNQVATERGIPVESVLESIRLALISAYRKDYGGEENVITSELDADTGEAKIFKDGEDVTPSGFGRIAAQTAKQVILQNIRETEKEVVYGDFKDRVGTIESGTVFRIDKEVIILDLGKAQGVLLPSEQVSEEVYRVGQRLKVLIKEVRDGSKGPEIVVSRSDPDFVKRLFEQEVPEIASGVVKIEAIAREAGSRTKIAVSSSDEKVDPVGSCVGRKGVRVQSIISEIFGEKIDIVPYSPMVEKFIAASLSPARVTEVELNEEERRAIVSVPEDQQSLAIGKAGQNARLANKLTRWKIDIKGAAGLFGETPTVSEQKTAEEVVGVWDAQIKEQRTRNEEEAAEEAAKVALEEAAKEEVISAEEPSEEKPVEEEESPEVSE